MESRGAVHRLRSHHEPQSLQLDGLVALANCFADESVQDRPSDACPLRGRSDIHPLDLGRSVTYRLQRPDSNQLLIDLSAQQSSSGAEQEWELAAESIVVLIQLRVREPDTGRSFNLRGCPFTVLAKKRLDSGRHRWLSDAKN